MMQIDIHDVGHGACSMVTCPDSTRLMIDCGCDPNRRWWPSIHYSGQFIDALIIQNLDEDHVQDLPDLWRNVRLGSMFTNPTIDARLLASMKRQGGMNSGVKFVHDLLQWRLPGAIGQLPVARGGGVSVWMTWNQYGSEFSDTNNLSVATVVRYGDFVALFAGDLEVKGWHGLLRFPWFREILPQVKVLVASHHGRDNGCSTEAFELLHPEVVVFSDDEVRYGTQDTADWYRGRVIGIPDLTKPIDPFWGFEKRHVLTTRRDGSLSLTVQPNGKYIVTGSRSSQPLPQPIGLGLPTRAGGFGDLMPGLLGLTSSRN